MNLNNHRLALLAVLIAIAAPLLLLVVPAGCRASEELQKLELMTDAEFELVAQDWESTADLATLAALRERVVKPEHAQLFAELLAAQPLGDRDPLAAAAGDAALEEAALRALTAKLRLRIARAGGCPLGPRGQVLLARVANAIRLAALRHMHFGTWGDEAPTASGDQQPDPGVTDGRE